MSVCLSYSTTACVSESITTMPGSAELCLGGWARPSRAGSPLCTCVSLAAGLGPHSICSLRGCPARAGGSGQLLCPGQLTACFPGPVNIGISPAWQGGPAASWGWTDSLAQRHVACCVECVEGVPWDKLPPVPGRPPKQLALQVGNRGRGRRGTGKRGPTTGWGCGVRECDQPRSGPGGGRPQSCSSYPWEW